MENLVGKMVSIDKYDHENDEILFSGVILVLVQTRNTVVGVNVKDPFPSYVSSSYSGLNTFDLNLVEWEYDENETPEDNIVLLRTISTVLSEQVKSKNKASLREQYEYTISLVQNVLVQIEQTQHKTKLDKAIDLLQRLEDKTLIENENEK